MLPGRRALLCVCLLTHTRWHKPQQQARCGRRAGTGRRGRTDAKTMAAGRVGERGRRRLGVWKVLKLAEIQILSSSRRQTTTLRAAADQVSSLWSADHQLTKLQFKLEVGCSRRMDTFATRAPGAGAALVLTLMLGENNLSGARAADHSIHHHDPELAGWLAGVCRVPSGELLFKAAVSRLLPADGRRSGCQRKYKLQQTNRRSARANKRPSSRANAAHRKSISHLWSYQTKRRRRRRQQQRR